VERFLDFAETYRDRDITSDGLAPRLHC
jgi:hypothetical protein